MRNAHKHPFTITPHDLQQQLQALKELLDKRDADWKQGWADTEVLISEATAFDDLAEARKYELKRK